MKHFYGALVLPVLLAACSHPLEIIGQGDLLSSTGQRDCLLEDFQSAQTSCTENMVTHGYQETYYGVPRNGWYFHRWANYCGDALDNACAFDVPGSAVEPFYGATAPPLVAIFRPEVVTGYRSLLIGHSFFNPFALQLPEHASRAGFVDHDQTRFFSGGGTGTPEAFWNNAGKRADIQAVLDVGDIELFGMTYHPQYPSMTGYLNWVRYALDKNPDTRFFIAMPWTPNATTFSAQQYHNIWAAILPGVCHSIVDQLRAEFPGVDVFCVPYGQAASELYSLWHAGQLPDVQAALSSTQDSIFNDFLGHADDILVELGSLVWLRAIYGVDLASYDYEPGYTTDLKGIATEIMDAHDLAYNNPEL
ncbi:MAG: hypothetical protein AAGA91_18535 [Pseudomonadota bacterium]